VKPWMRHTITALVTLTLPIWFIPFMLGLVVFLFGFGLYDSIYRALWGK